MKMKILFVLLMGILFFNISCKKEEPKKDDSAMMMKSTKEAVQYTGYVLDTLCATAGKGLDGSDVLNSPQDHTKHCLEICKDSGFGIMTKNSAGIYQFVKFDSDGSDLAYQLIEKSAKEKGISISVEGTLENDILTVTKLNEQ